MIKVDFKPPVGDAKWDAWIKTVETETSTLIKGGEPYNIKSRLYKAMKKALFKGFNYKCAYCEDNLLSQPGDVEHFRPKLGVTDENDKPVLWSPRSKKLHPGYFWLAYHWENLLPSCNDCNRPHRASDGSYVGKGTRFPVLSSSKLKTGRAIKPKQERLERPVFIHPVKENPLTHFVLDGPTGIIGGKTKRGRECIRMLDLNRDRLPEERRDIYLSTISNLDYAIRAKREGRIKDFLDRLIIINGYQNGSKAYSWAGRKALEDRADLLAEFQRLQIQ